MANNNLVKKKPVALEVATYERLSKLAAQLRIDNPGGGFVSMSTAVERLLNLWDVQAVEKSNDGWNISKETLPFVGAKLLVQFPSGATHRANYFEHDGFSVYLEEGQSVNKAGFYPFSSMTCVKWKFEPENETE